MRLHISKKGVMGVGMIFIFIATVLASAIAAAVLITSTESIQEKAYSVQESATERLLTGFEIISVYGSGDMVNETLNEFEIILRLRSGSSPINFDKTGFSFIAGNLSLSGEYNKSLGNDNCSYSNLPAETDFCVDQHFGTKPDIMRGGDMASVRYKLEDDHALGTETDFIITMQTPKGRSQVTELTVPDMILASKVKLR
ncbi:MAG: hypothetical protein ACLFSN_01270 [Candidatus Woesearchaeota archaeon]